MRVDSNERQRRYRERHPDRYRAAVRRCVAKLRAAVLALLGDRCASPSCRWLNEDGSLGCTDRRALQIDHINGGGSKEQRELGGPDQIWRKILKMQNPEKEYQILCATCNWIKRTSNSEVTGAPKKY